MRILLVLLVICSISAPATATLLRYDLTFHANQTLSGPGESYNLNGSGFLYADTELEAIIGGRLVSKDIKFSWYNTSLSPLTFLGSYDYADHLVDEPAYGINEVTGTPGFLQLWFVLSPQGKAPYTARLDSNSDYDNWSLLDFPSANREDSPWENQPLRTDFYLAPPTFADGTPLPVPEPAPFMLLVLASACLGLRRSIVRSRPFASSGQ